MAVKRNTNNTLLRGCWCQCTRIITRMYSNFQNIAALDIVSIISQNKKVLILQLLKIQ